MIPQQDLIIIDDLIIENISLSDEEIINLVGKGYYNFYKSEIDNLIAMYRNEPYFDIETHKIIF